MDVMCPNCDKVIHLVGARELRDEFSIGPNSVANAREKGKFPEPWLSFANRNIWIRKDVEEYVSRRSAQRVEEHVSALIKALDHLPPEAKRDARKALEAAGVTAPRRK